MRLFSDIMNKFSDIKNRFTGKAPKVACPKCGKVHEINSECKCPDCGLKYKLPPEYDSYIESAKASEANSLPQDIDVQAAKTGTEYSNEALIEAEKKKKQRKSGTIIKFSAFALAFSALFLILVLIFFKDKDALIFKTGEYVNQPVFYHTKDGVLHCAFPGNKNCNIGKGEIVSYLSSADGKCVYLTFTGEFASKETSNYVLRISNFGKKIVKISENASFVPHIVAGGNNKYLYILTPKDQIGNIFDLTLCVDGEKPTEVAKDVKEIAVSTSGRFALVNLEDSGTSKLMVYSAANGELTNPGIKNAHPLSIDNKGEYMIYARKSTAESTDIIIEKSTTERVEIPIFKNSALKSVIFSEDRRTFAAQYSDKTVFYTCTDKDYTISNTYEGSLFGYDFNDKVSLNYLSFKEIPAILNVYGKNLLPYYFYDKDNKYVYVISDGGTKEAVFDTYTIDNLKVSAGDKCAFVSNDILYTGRLNRKNNDITKIITFGDKTLVDISPDGEYVYYKDFDGNLFKTEYGKAAKNPTKIAVDTDILRVSSDNSKAIAVSEKTAEIIGKNGKAEKLCEGIEISESVLSSDNLSVFFYVVTKTDEQSGESEKSLYLYRKGKSKLISDKVADVCLIRNSEKIDITKSFYVDMILEPSGNEAVDPGGNNTITSSEVQSAKNSSEPNIPVPTAIS